MKMTRITKTMALSMILALAISVWAMEGPVPNHEKECQILRIKKIPF